MERAIVVAVSGDFSDIDERYTHDAAGSGPATNARSREELALEVEQRMAALTQAEVTFGNVDRQGDVVRLEREASALHIGRLVLKSNGPCRSRPVAVVEVHDAVPEATLVEQFEFDMDVVGQ